MAAQNASIDSGVNVQTLSAILSTVRLKGKVSMDS